MGYYSDVAITLQRKDYNELIRKAEEESSDASELVQSATLYTKTFDSRNDYVILYFGGVKWYESFDDVKFIMDFLHSDIKYAFQRIGEDSGDYEEEFSPDYKCEGLVEYVRYFDFGAFQPASQGERLIEEQNIRR